DEEDGDRQMAPPAGNTLDHVREQREPGEARTGGPPAALVQHVDADQRGDGDERHERDGIAECHRTVLRRNAASGLSQSPDVDRTTCLAPVEAMARDTPCRPPDAAAAPSPNVTMPRRLPRRVATRPSASATPSATSAFRRSAVPNCIEADVSRTSQVTSTRSARCTRTCGSPVRAVTFQSIRRTSSPGTYGRTCASSVPTPIMAER